MAKNYFLNVCFVRASSQQLYVVETLDFFVVLGKTFLLCSIEVFFKMSSFGSFFSNFAILLFENCLISNIIAHAQFLLISSSILRSGYLKTRHVNNTVVYMLSYMLCMPIHFGSNYVIVTGLCIWNCVDYFFLIGWSWHLAVQGIPVLRFLMHNIAMS